MLAASDTALEMDSCFVTNHAVSSAHLQEVCSKPRPGASRAPGPGGAGQVGAPVPAEGGPRHER